MKTAIVTILLVIFALTGQALAVDGELRLGRFANSSNLPARPGALDGPQALFYTSLELGHWMFNDRVRPWVRIETFMDENAGLAFHPTSDKYWVGLQIMLHEGSEVITTLELNHYCWHPVDSVGPVEQRDYVGLSFKF